MNDNIEIKRYVKCPACNEAAGHLYEELKDGTYKWYCDCGNQYSFEYKDGNVLKVESTGNFFAKTRILLANDDIALIIKGNRYFTEGRLTDDEHDRYYYDEHTCPTNYMRDVIEVIDLRSMDTDPHGVFRYIKTIENDEEHVDPELFGMAFYDLLKKHHSCKEIDFKFPDLRGE